MSRFRLSFMSLRRSGIALVVLVALASATGSCIQEPAPDAARTPPPLTPVPAELEVVSNLNVAAGPGQISDVWAHNAANGKSYAYLGTFDMPSCGRDITGVHIIDITNAARPAKAAFLPVPVGLRVNDVKVGHMRTTRFTGDILVHSLEFCTGRVEGERAAVSPGIALYDVTDPTAPRRLASGFSLGFEVHNTFVYQRGERAFVLVVQDESARDFHIVEITDPEEPVTVFTGGWRDWLGADAQVALGTLPVALVHDVWAQTYPPEHTNPHYAGKTIAYLANWDAGLILLDVTDPAQPVFLGDSDYQSPDPLTGKPPEGNSHSAVPTADGDYVFMGDEDFAPFRTLFTVDSGDFAGEYRALESGFTPPLSQVGGGAVSGQAVFIGKGCAAADIPSPPGASGDDFIALVEAGVCGFDDKVNNAAQAGYRAALVFPGAGDPEIARPPRGAPDKGKVPAFAVSRQAAFAILGMSPASPPDTPLPATGTAGQRVTLKSDFDGWGYARILDVRDPGNIAEVGQYVTREALQNPPPPGEHSMHNQMIEGRRAYVAWYSDGMRVIDFSDPSKPREIARFVDTAKGSDFWGVYLHAHPDGNTYILGSDRSTGLWVFRKP